MLLQGKTAVVYGGGGAIGGAVARGFAREGAVVHLVGRTAEKLERTAEAIRSAGGEAHPAVLDAADERQVEEHAEAVTAGGGRWDASINLVSFDDVQGTPIVDLPPEDYLRPVTSLLQTCLVTSRAAGRRMAAQGSGAILFFGGYGHPLRQHRLGGLLSAFHAVEALRTSLAVELGPSGVRVVTLQTGGVPESFPPDADPEFARRIAEETAGLTLLGRAATLDDVAAAAAFAASDHARTVTGSAINITCGSVLG